MFQYKIHRSDLRNNPKVYYVFGDNEARQGYGGQAASMRGEPNAIGICTKASPHKYWSDINYAQNCKAITEDFYKIKTALHRGDIVVIPTMGIGTGYSKLQEKAPKTWEVLQEFFSALFEVFNVERPVSWG